VESLGCCPTVDAAREGERKNYANSASENKGEGLVNCARGREGGRMSPRFQHILNGPEATSLREKVSRRNTLYHKGELGSMIQRGRDLRFRGKEWKHWSEIKEGFKTAK